MKVVPFHKPFLTTAIIIVSKPHIERECCETGWIQRKSTSCWGKTHTTYQCMVVIFKRFYVTQEKRHALKIYIAGTATRERKHRVVYFVFNLISDDPRENESGLQITCYVNVCWDNRVSPNVRCCSNVFACAHIRPYESGMQKHFSTPLIQKPPTRFTQDMPGQHWSLYGSQSSSCCRQRSD